MRRTRARTVSVRGDGDASTADSSAASRCRRASSARFAACSSRSAITSRSSRCASSYLARHASRSCSTDRVFAPSDLSAARTTSDDRAEAGNGLSACARAEVGPRNVSRTRTRRGTGPERARWRARTTRRARQGGRVPPATKARWEDPATTASWGPPSRRGMMRTTRVCSFPFRRTTSRASAATLLPGYPPTDSNINPIRTLARRGADAPYSRSRPLRTRQGLVSPLASQATYAPSRFPRWPPFPPPRASPPPPARRRRDRETTARVARAPPRAPPRAAA